MPFVHILDTAKLEIVGHSTTTLQPVVNVLHVGIAEVDQTQVKMQAMADAVGAAVLADVTQWSNEWTGDFVRCTGLKTATAPQATNFAIAGALGTGASAPINACALIKLTTALRGRAYRGRVFMSPLKASYVSNGSNITSGARATFDVFINDIQAALAGLTPPSTLCIARRTGPAFGGSEDVTGWSTELEMASQRRRLVGR